MAIRPIAQHTVNKQTAIYNAMNKLIHRTTIKQKWRKFKFIVFFSFLRAAVSAVFQLVAPAVIVPRARYVMYLCFRQINDDEKLVITKCTCIL